MVKATEENEVDLLDEDELVLTKSGEYKPKTISHELYQQQKMSQARQATTAGGLALAGELGQFFVGLSTMNDPTIKAARRDLTRLEAQTQEKGPLITESEKSSMRQAAMAPVERAQEALERKAQNIAASTGDGSARTFLKAAQVGMKDVADQALNIESGIQKVSIRRADERDKRIQVARDQADSIKAMMLDLRNTYVREPLHKFIGDAAKYTGTALAYAAEPSYERELQEALDAGANQQDIKKLIALQNRPFAKKRIMKQIDEIRGRGEKPDSGEELSGEMSETRARKDEQGAPKAWTDKSTTGDWADVEYRLLPNGDIAYELKGSTKTAKKNTPAHAAIMSHRPKGSE